MPRKPKLWFDRGTLVLHPPPRGKAWIDFATWDDRIEKFRIPALHYRDLVAALQSERTDFIDTAGALDPLEGETNLTKTPYPHQQEALECWQQAQQRGVVVLPTAAGKTYLAQLALERVRQPTLVVVPTLDLMHQWYAQLEVAFPTADLGLLGGGSRDRAAILVATYDSAAIHAETLGGRYGFLIFDECHHLPTEFYRSIAEFAIAPFRLGLTATPERSDGAHTELDELIGPIIYRRSAVDLSGQALAPYDVVQIKVDLAPAESKRYRAALAKRDRFLREKRIFLGGLQGWQRFVRESARSQAGRQAMLAHREAKDLALCTGEKLQVLAELIRRHFPESILIFTNDNRTVYRISEDFLIPALTHQTPVKERHAVLTKFRDGTYKVLVASHVLNEGVDVPEARVAIILSGTGSTREFVQRLGRVLRKGRDGSKRAVLYEVIAADTTEERTSQRRHSETVARLEAYGGGRMQPSPRAAEPTGDYRTDGPEDRPQD